MDKATAASAGQGIIPTLIEHVNKIDDKIKELHVSQEKTETRIVDVETQQNHDNLIDPGKTSQVSYDDLGDNSNTLHGSHFVMTRPSTGRPKPFWEQKVSQWNFEPLTDVTEREFAHCENPFRGRFLLYADKHDRTEVNADIQYVDGKVVKVMQTTEGSNILLVECSTNVTKLVSEEAFFSEWVASHYRGDGTPDSSSYAESLSIFSHEDSNDVVSNVDSNPSNSFRNLSANSAENNSDVCSDVDSNPSNSFRHQSSDDEGLYN